MNFNWCYFSSNAAPLISFLLKCWLIIYFSLSFVYLERRRAQPGAVTNVLCLVFISSSISSNGLFLYIFIEFELYRKTFDIIIPNKTSNRSRFLMVKVFIRSKDTIYQSIMYSLTKSCIKYFFLFLKINE